MLEARLFVQQLIQVNKKKIHITVPLWKQSTDIRWIRMI